MRLTKQIEQTVNIELTTGELIDATIQHIRQLHDIPLGGWASGDGSSWLVEKEYITTHSWTEVEVHKQMNSSDHDALHLINALNKEKQRWINTLHG